MYSTELKKHDDLQLVARYRQTDDSNCVGLLFERYSHLIFGVCMKYLKNEADAQDASMQIFEKLLKDLHRHEIQYFKGWLHMVCKNFCLMALRSKTLQRKKDSNLEKELTSVMDFTDQLHPSPVQAKELKLTLMEECIQKLNLEQKKCVELFYLQEKSYQEVASLTNYTMNNVKSYIQNGKRNLKICIESKPVNE